MLRRKKFKAGKTNPLRDLQESGQSFWLDYLRRSLITTGKLHRLIEEDGLSGVTSNLAIFQRVIAGSLDYDDIINDSIKTNPLMDVHSIFEKILIEDCQLAADILRPVYEKTERIDGFVSLELPPHLVHDTAGSITEARRLWKTIKRPNILIEIPATPEGISVIETLIEDGININATFIFSLSNYETVANAYIRGLERCPDPSRVASVASFFLSNIDSVVNKALEEIGTSKALSLRGKIAIATAKMAYKRSKEIFSGERWERLAKRGGHVQRILWANTSIKTPVYSDVHYVEEIIGINTISAMASITINAFRDHGQVRPTLEKGHVKAENYLKRLAELSVDLNTLIENLQGDSIGAFADSFDEILSTLEKKRQAMLHGQLDLRIMRLGKYQNQVDTCLKHWEESNFIERLWEKDPTLWIPKPVPEITDRLGWLILPDVMYVQLKDFISFADEVKLESIRHVVLIGMGGSSLVSEVFQDIFGNANGYPELIVLDSTHPSAISTIESKIDLCHTLFLVSSKSGTTIETLSLFRYFWKKVGLVDKDPGRHFVAITDPGTPLMKLAQERDFRHVFQALPDVGGRYSALTVFGLLPASLIGMDVRRFLDQSRIMSENCAFCVSSYEALGLNLGAALGEVAKMGRDKVTFLTSTAISSFPVWLEQLIAESTGKNGKGIIPIVNEPLTSPDSYGSDRFFIYFFNEKNDNRKLEKLVVALEAIGHPIVHINLTEKINVSQEIFCWEIAVAAAGALLGINPFNQPDIKMTKNFTKKIMNKVKKGILDEKNEGTVSAENLEELTKALKSWLSNAKDGDYVTIQAYLSPTRGTTEALQEFRLELLDHLRLATTLCYGPRFLHSTGQLHKGGPESGIFIQLIDEPVEDLEVPETDYTFGTLIQVQALVDFRVLNQLNHRVLRINLKRNVVGNLNRLTELLREKNSILWKK